MQNFKFSKKFTIKFNGVAGIIFSLMVIWLISFVFTFVAWFSVKKANFETARVFFNLVKPISVVSSTLTLGKVPIIEFWKQNIFFGQEITNLNNLQGQEDLIGGLVNNYHWNDSLTYLDQMLANGQQSWLVSKVSASKGYSLKELNDLVKLFKVINQEKESGKKYLLIFQNSDELRATGGFIGSYAVLDFNNQDFLDFKIRDIYDPSGLSQSQTAPLGHDFYLSGGAGLKLHDANWSADFPTTANNILWFFAKIEGDPQYYDGVIAFNFATLEKAVSLLGDIYLPDQGTSVKAEQLASLLRADRSEFFPGSNQKENNLASLQTALLLKISSLSNQELADFVRLFLQEKIWRDVQFFATDEQVENTFIDLGVGGELYRYQSDELYVFPVESNVGINKANHWVSRSINVNKNDKLLRLKINFNNQATSADRPVLPIDNEFYKTADHLGYINYYRLITSINLELVSVTVGDQVLNDWDKTELTLDNGYKYYQYGFLVTVPEARSIEVITDFAQSITSSRVIFQKQSGLSYQNISGQSVIWTKELE